MQRTNNLLKFCLQLCDILTLTIVTLKARSQEKMQMPLQTFLPQFSSHHMKFCMDKENLLS